MIKDLLGALFFDGYGLLNAYKSDFHHNIIDGYPQHMYGSKH